MIYFIYYINLLYICVYNCLKPFQISQIDISSLIVIYHRYLSFSHTYLSHTTRTSNPKMQLIQPRKIVWFDWKGWRVRSLIIRARCYGNRHYCVNRCAANDLADRSLSVSHAMHVYSQPITVIIAVFYQIRGSPGTFVSSFLVFPPDRRRTERPKYGECAGDSLDTLCKIQFRRVSLRVSVTASLQLNFSTIRSRSIRRPTKTDLRE